VRSTKLIRISLAKGEQDALADVGRLRCHGRDGTFVDSGPWGPRLIEKDPVGVVVGDVGGPPRSLAPGTPITPAVTHRCLLETRQGHGGAPAVATFPTCVFLSQKCESENEHLTTFQIPDLLSNFGLHVADHLGGRTVAKFLRELMAPGESIFEGLLDGVH
jgi:hypothetical protein